MQFFRATSRRRRTESVSLNSKIVRYDNLDKSDYERSQCSIVRFFGWLFRRFVLTCKRKWTYILVFLLFVSYFLYYVSNDHEKDRFEDELTSTIYVSSFIRSVSKLNHEKNGKFNEIDGDHERTDEFFKVYEADANRAEATNRRIDELNRIRISVLNELRSLEEKRNHLRTEIDALMIQSERMQSELREGVKDLERVRISIEQARIARQEMTERNTPEIALPRPLVPRPFTTRDEATWNRESRCSMSTCFDYSRCSITNSFPVYIYGNDQLQSDIFDRDLIEIFASTPYVIDDPSLACVFLVLLKHGVGLSTDVIDRLPYWNSGINHLVNGNALFNHVGNALSNHVDNSSNHMDSSNHVNDSFYLGRSMIFGDQFPYINDSYGFRFGFDIHSPRISVDVPDNERFLELSPIVPARRRYFLSIFTCPSHTNEREFIIEQYDRLRNSKTDDTFYFTSCFVRSSNDTRINEKGILDQSTFTLLLQENRSALTQPFIDALKHGAIPVILTTSNRAYPQSLPFGETLDWNWACIQLPLARLPELHYYLRTLTDSDIVNIRRQGRLLYENYFSTNTRIVETILAVLRQRLNLPAAPELDVSLPSLYNETHQPIFGDMTTKANDIQYDDEYLGPIELPYASPKYQQNFTCTWTFSYKLWNVYGDPFRSYPQFPFTKHALPSEAKFTGSPYGYRPINNGAGGSGKEFSEALGGNFPREQFTVVLLTYEREQVLIAALSRLNNLPYLNKIIVVWNGPTSPDRNLLWPKLTAPIVVLKPEKNSLNNRFLPFREIETEAVLSMDDDVHLRRDEIIFAFRAWREARDKIVGFPARYHAWDSSVGRWSYNSNHSCELSMVLTGAAFIHKYYFYVYTYRMPAAIRRKVDELMNCEDLAMNFLVSHLTKAAPLKATSRWTFRCPGCPETLSADETHFVERHDCLNYFTRVYGYTPLLYTQFRVDSILFKMRIPQTHQKCFKYI